MAPVIESETTLPIDNITSPRGIVAIVDDDPQISQALGLWLDLQGLRAVHYISGESLLQSISHGAGFHIAEEFMQAS